MDEDDELPDVQNRSTQSDRAKVEKEEAAVAEECPPAPVSDVTHPLGSTSPASETETRIADEGFSSLAVDVEPLLIEGKDEESVAKTALSLVGAEEKEPTMEESVLVVEVKTELVIAERLNEEQIVEGKGEIHTEADVPVTELVGEGAVNEEYGAMGYRDLHSETQVGDLRDNIAKGTGEGVEMTGVEGELEEVEMKEETPWGTASAEPESVDEVGEAEALLVGKTELVEAEAETELAEVDLQSELAVGGAELGEADTYVVNGEIETDSLEAGMGKDALEAEMKEEVVEAEMGQDAMEAGVGKDPVEAEMEKEAVETEMGEGAAEIEMRVKAVKTEVGIEAGVAEARVVAVKANSITEVVESERKGGVEDIMRKEDVENVIGMGDGEAKLGTEDVEVEMGTEDVEAETGTEDGEAEMTMENVEAEMGTEGAETEMETDMVEAETETDMLEVDTETDMVESEVVADELRAGAGKRKRGRNSRAPARLSQRKKVEEDVCFICFDGGELVLCDRRGCPKAYHPSCVNRDEAFFRAKGRWNCGWHICSICEKNAYYMCYTCTYSLCKGCSKDTTILCVRGNKGLCEACMRTVLMIEQSEQDQIDFNDKSSWEYLFKDYWTDLKGKLNITSDELAQAKRPSKVSDVRETRDANNGTGSDTDRSENQEASKPKRKKGKKRLSKSPKELPLPDVKIAEGSSAPGATEWASKELLEFVMHMKNGDGSILSQFDVQAYLLEYIKRNKLRDPRRKSQIICDFRLENLFGKARVGHFEMLKLLESHFLLKEDTQADDVQGSVVDTETSQLEVDGSTDAPTKGGRDKKRKMRKKDGKGPQSNLHDYAAIDMHNINLIYLRRNLVEELIGDDENFHDKVVGSFVRIRISASVQKQDIYRLVQVVGTSKAAEPYKVGKKTTDFMLEILNLNKVEVISIDIISNQDFTEDECKRLRQSIKCGLIDRLTVGSILEKAMALHAVRVNDWVESEILRLSHLRDRASEKGRRKELRECVEKLQLLKTAGERQRRLEEIPEVHADPNMDPSHESEEEEEEDNKRQDVYMRPRGGNFGRRGREPLSPGTGASNDSWSGARKNSSNNRELSRNLSDKDYLNRGEDIAATDIMHETSHNQGRDKYSQQSNVDKLKAAAGSEASAWNESPNSAGPRSALVAQYVARVNETDKMWHYQDPSGKVQGPFSMVQLRKWSNTGYFPVDLKIWTATESRDASVLLTDILTEYFPKEQSLVDGSKSHGASLPQSKGVQGSERATFDQNHEAGRLNNTVGPTGQSRGDDPRSQQELTRKAWAAPSVTVPRDKWGSEHGGSNDSNNLPSPTPTQGSGSRVGGQASGSKQLPSSISVHSPGSNLGSGSFAGGNRMLQSRQITDLSGPSVVNQSIGVDVSGQGSRTSANSLSGSTLMPTSGNDPSSLNGVQGLSQSTMFSESGRMQANIHHVAPNIAGGSKNLVVSQNPETHGWGAGSVSTPMPTQQPTYNQWPQSVSSVGSPFNGVNPGGTFPAPALPPHNPWRPPALSSQIESGSTVQPPVHPQSLPWNMSIPDGQSAAPNLRPENLNAAWGPMSGSQNMSWGGPAPNPNMNWGGQALAPGVTNPGMAPGGTIPGMAPGGTNPGMAPGGANMNWGPAQGMTHGNSNAGPTPTNMNINWGAVGHGPPPGNVNVNSVPAPGNVNNNWAASGQGPLPGNTNPGWVAPTGNSGMWGDQNHDSERLTNARDRGSQGGDSGYGGGRPWNMQSSFSGGGSRSQSGQRDRDRERVCRFHENGHCRKGASCNYLHP